MTITEYCAMCGEPMTSCYCSPALKPMGTVTMTVTPGTLAPRREDATEPKTIAATACNTCGEQQNAAGYCTNKQCSRHGRRNDYLAAAPRREDAAGAEPPRASPYALDELLTIIGVLKNALSTAEREREALRDALANVVVKCIPSGTQDGDFVLLYKIPTGPIHHAIPLLDSMGITVRPGFDGRARVPSGGA